MFFLQVHPRAESRLRGDKNGNLEKLTRLFPKLQFTIIRDDRLALDKVSLNVV